MNNRDYTIDIIKGICIILMMLGHVLYSTSIFRHIIYSFHMPLFFIVGGVYLKKFNFKKDFHRLLLPYFIFGSIGSIAINGDNFAPPNILDYDLNPFLHAIFRYLWLIFSSLFWGCCGHHHLAPLCTDVPLIAALWFLPAYFVGKNVYLLFKKTIPNKYALGFCCFVISLSAMVIDNYVIYLPFAINQGLSTLFFFYLGNNIDVKKMHWGYGSVLTIIWILGLFLTDINIAFSYLNRFSIIGVLGAFGAYFLLANIINNIRINKIIEIPHTFLQYVGLNSLHIFCFHYLIMVWAFNPLIGRNFIWVAYLMALVFPIILQYIGDVTKNTLENKNKKY